MGWNNKKKDKNSEKITKMNHNQVQHMLLLVLILEFHAISFQSNQKVKTHLNFRKKNEK